jgi:gamma-glutamylcyclotransferase (GGCT)/AIG2-like uncharacterized protein YtfP
MMPEASLPAGGTAAPARHVFVYGTLRAGERNDIARFGLGAEFVGRGEIAGILYDLGTYPGATLGGSGRVQGEVYRIGPALEAALDRLEAVQPDDEGLYRKRELTVQVGAGGLSCLVYEIHPRQIVGRPVIASGDWLVRG